MRRCRSGMGRWESAQGRGRRNSALVRARASCTASSRDGGASVALVMRPPPLLQANIAVGGRAAGRWPRALLGAGWRGGRVALAGPRRTIARGFPDVVTPPGLGLAGSWGCRESAGLWLLPSGQSFARSGDGLGGHLETEIGRASCRERV